LRCDGFNFFGRVKASFVDSGAAFFHIAVPGLLSQVFGPKRPGGALFGTNGVNAAAAVGFQEEAVTRCGFEIGIRVVYVAICADKFFFGYPLKRGDVDDVLLSHVHIRVVVFFSMGCAALSAPSAFEVQSFLVPAFIHLLD